MGIEKIMIMKRMTSNPSEQLKAALEWCDKFEDTSRREIMVDKDVYFNAEKISKKLNTNVDGVFCLCAYRILIMDLTSTSPITDHLLLAR